MGAILTSIGGGFLSISLDLHSTGDSSVGLTAGQVGHVDEGIVECGQDVADTKDVLGLLASTSGRRSVVSDFLFLSSAFFTFSASLGTTLLLLSLRLHTKRDEWKQVWLPYYLLMRDIE